jgi:hypothetical protein
MDDGLLDRAVTSGWKRVGLRGSAVACKRTKRETEQSGDDAAPVKESYAREHDDSPALAFCCVRVTANTL